MTTVATASQGRQGEGGVMSTTGFLSGRSPSADLFVSPVTNASPCQISSYIQLSERPIDAVNASSSADTLAESENSQKSNENVSSFSFFEAVRALYLPFLLQSFLGGFDFVRYVLFGQLLELHQQSATAIRASSYIAWLNSPALASCLTCLALFACVAMAVHPDGFTWLAVRKLRDLFMSILQSSSTCWAWLLNDDTGVISTTLALATFCALFFFCYVLHRTLAPKQPRPVLYTVSSTESSSTTAASKSSGPSSSYTTKKKKKKKNSAKKRNPPTAPVPNDAVPSNRDPSPEPQTQLQPGPRKQEEISDLAVSGLDETNDESNLRSSSSIPATETNPPPDSSGVLIGPELTLSEASSATMEKRSPQKSQPVLVASTSTVDTSASSVLEEDPSSHHHHKQRNQNSHSHHSRSKRSPNNSSGRGGSTSHTSHNYYQNNNPHSGKSSSELVVSSRWDALKPDSPAGATRNHRSSYNNSNQKISGGTAAPLGLQYQRGSPRGMQSNRSAVISQTWTLNEASTIVGPHRPSSTSTGRGSPDAGQMHYRDHQTQLQGNLLGPLPVPSQSPRDSFFSSLNPQSPPFAPSTPPKILRVPPGLGLPEQPEPIAQLDSMGEFLLPPTRGPYEPFLQSASPPPGLMVPSGATLSPGSGSPLCFRAGTRSTLPENPFQDVQENEAQIEAELQELGGRMIGSILDS